MAFVFYDTETTGLRPEYDQLIQFAAIRTDSDLQEIDRLELRSRINPNTVPHLEAMTANGLPIECLTDTSLTSHYRMMREVNSKLIAWSPSIFLGYNSIRFDEEFLRHALFQTLHSPYLTSLHGNGRNDVFSLVLACHAVSNGALIVPMREGETPSFRLEDLSAANDIKAVKSHDAMSDAESTLALCRLVKERSSDLWQRFIRFSNKASASYFISSEDGFILTEFFANRAYHTPVVFLENEPEQPNGRLCLSLFYDPTEISSWTKDQLRTALLAKPSPVRKIRTNAGPTMMPLWEAPEQLLGQMSVEELEDRAIRVAENEELKRSLVDTFSETRAQYPEPTEVEEMLYTGFPNWHDEELLRQFHQSPWHERHKIVQRIADVRLFEFGMRLIHFEARSTLPSDVAQEMDTKLAQRLISENGNALSLTRALEQLDELQHDRKDDSDTVNLARGYRAYLLDRKAKVLRFLSN